MREWQSLPRVSAPKPSPPGVSVPAAVAVLMDSRMETTAGETEGRGAGRGEAEGSHSH